MLIDTYLSPHSMLSKLLPCLYNLTGHNATPWPTDGQLVSTAHLPGRPTSNRDTRYPTPDGHDAQIPPATHSQPPARCLNPPSTTMTMTPLQLCDAGMDKLAAPPLAPWAWHDDATTTTTTTTTMMTAPPLTPCWHRRHHHRDPAVTMPL
jgi:hypothetical protein